MPDLRFNHMELTLAQGELTRSLAQLEDVLELRDRVVPGLARESIDDGEQVGDAVHVSLLSLEGERSIEVDEGVLVLLAVAVPRAAIPDLDLLVGTVHREVLVQSRVLT